MKFEIKKSGNDDVETKWINWWSNLDAEPFTFNVERTVFKNDKFHLFNSDNEAITVYCTNPENSKFDSTPHGVRLANAIGRCFNLKGEVDADTLTTNMNAAEPTVKVEKTEKGTLWSVSIDA
tara:strand:- start:90 stop:455 length:366 start_codon:yes stop_codon:yes gene_type:complete